MTVWEPCAGNKAMADVLAATGAKLVCTDLYPRADGVGEGDFFTTTELPEGVNAIITNPPFAPAAKFIRHALSFQPLFFALLLKSTFWHAKGRHPLWQQFTPSYVHPLLWRPDFLGLGRPTMEVSWVVWINDGRHCDCRYEPLPRPKMKIAVMDLSGVCDMP
jgi:hypothetical protein